MKILIDIGHPAHVYKFLNLIKILENNNKVIVTTKNIITVISLLNKFNIDFINIGEKFDSLFLKFYNQIIYDIRLFKIARNNNIDIIIGSISAAHISKFLNY